MSAARTQVLVCTNSDCDALGAAEVRGRLRLAVREAGARAEVEVLATPCLGCCGAGPVVVLWPANVWYKRVRSSDAEEIVRESALGGRPVERLRTAETHELPEPVRALLSTPPP